MKIQKIILLLAVVFVSNQLNAANAKIDKKFLNSISQSTENYVMYKNFGVAVIQPTTFSDETELRIIGGGDTYLKMMHAKSTEDSSFGVTSLYALNPEFNWRLTTNGVSKRLFVSYSNKDGQDYWMARPSLSKIEVSKLKNSTFVGTLKTPIFSGVEKEKITRSDNVYKNFKSSAAKEYQYRTRSEGKYFYVDILQKKKKGAYDNVLVGVQINGSVSNGSNCLSGAATRTCTITISEPDFDTLEFAFAKKVTFQTIPLNIKLNAPAPSNANNDVAGVKAFLIQRFNFAQKYVNASYEEQKKFVLESVPADKREEFNAFPEEFQKEIIPFFINDATGGKATVEEYTKLLNDPKTVYKFNSSTEVNVTFVTLDSPTSYSSSATKLKKGNSGWVLSFE